MYFTVIRELPDVMSAYSLDGWTHRTISTQEKEVLIESRTKMRIVETYMRIN